MSSWVGRYLRVVEATTLLGMFVAFSTTAALYHHPRFYEQNPVMDWVFGTLGFYVAPFLVVAICAISYRWFAFVADHLPRFAIAVAAWPPVLFAWDALTNLLLFQNVRAEHLFVDGGELTVLLFAALAFAWLFRAQILERAPHQLVAADTQS